MEKEMILCDSNILIEVYKNNKKIIAELEEIGQQNIAVSQVTACELVYGALNKKELAAITGDLQKIVVLPITHHISESAYHLMVKFSLSHKLSLPDALIAATVLDHKISIYTLNLKDFKFIPDIKFLS